MSVPAANENKMLRGRFISQHEVSRSTSSEAYGKHSFELDLTNQPSGVYFVRVQQGDAKVTKKVIKF